MSLEDILNLKDLSHHKKFCDRASGAILAIAQNVIANEEQTKLKFEFATEENEHFNATVPLIKKDGSENIKYGTWLVKDFMYPSKVEKTNLQKNEDGTYLLSEFSNKKIGLVLERREYVVDGNTKFAYGINAFFDPETSKTASEISNNQEALEVEKLVHIVQNKLSNGFNPSLQKAQKPTVGSGMFD